MTLAYRSLLFAAGHDATRLRAAFASEADAVVADLEDSVPAAEKDRARDVVADVLGGPTGTAARLVRINSPEGGPDDRELELLAALEVDAVVVPKATPEIIAALGPTGPPIIAVVETAFGLRLAFETASSARVEALALGANDLAAELGLEPTDGAQELLYARSKLVVDSRAAGLRGPFDRVYPGVNDLAGLEADAVFARSLGFRGKNALQPAQIATINAVFSALPDPAAKNAIYGT
ncbi:MAG: (3S)-malyl-CoA thioesterase [Actinomycetota bacterium]|nr:(3S)-malyl-CoA thioesterase [Actinomycetota bacterium]